jgi:hypothetical protein
VGGKTAVPSSGGGGGSFQTERDLLSLQTAGSVKPEG